MPPHAPRKLTPEESNRVRLRYYKDQYITHKYALLKFRRDNGIQMDLDDSTFLSQCEKDVPSVLSFRHQYEKDNTATISASLPMATRINESKKVTTESQPVMTEGEVQEWIGLGI